MIQLHLKGLCVCFFIALLISKNELKNATVPNERNERVRSQNNKSSQHQRLTLSSLTLTPDKI
jgi:hypothetical protein